MRQVSIITNAEMVKVIKRHMQREGLTMAAMSRKIGVNYQYFYEMVIGRWPVTGEVARYFGFERLDQVFAEQKPRKKVAKPKAPKAPAA
ncbi:MAG: helix-turn-helix transcriptional regulator [Anaerolineae bacterium]